MSYRLYAAVGSPACLGFYFLLGPAVFGTTLLVLPFSLVVAAFVAYVTGCAIADGLPNYPPSDGPSSLDMCCWASVPIFAVTFGFVQYALTTMLLYLAQS